MLLRSVLCYREVCRATAKRYVTAKRAVNAKCVVRMRSVLWYCEVCYVTVKCATLLRSVLCNHAVNPLDYSAWVKG